MLYALAADAVAALHLSFISFVVFGGLAVLWRPKTAYWHAPIAVYGISIQFIQWTCPLTPLENYLRRAAGEEGYEGGFIAHYLVPLVYPEGASRRAEIAAGIALIAFNAAVYFFAWFRWRKRGR